MDVKGAALGHSDPVAWVHTPRDPRSVPLTKLHPSAAAAYIPSGEELRLSKWGVPDPREYYAGETLDPLRYDSPYWSFATEWGMVGSYVFPGFDAHPFTEWAVHPDDILVTNGRDWQPDVVYPAGQTVRLQGSSAFNLYRSLRDGNVGHRPTWPLSAVPTTEELLNKHSLEPDWWQYLGSPVVTNLSDPWASMPWGSTYHISSGSYYYKIPQPYPSGCSNWPGWGLSMLGAWSGRAVEAGVQVGADQWASGECQCDNIGPGVRINVATKDCYHTATEYVYYPEDDPEYAGPLAPGPAGAHKGTVRLFRMRNGVSAVLATWPNVGIHRFGGPWCIKLAAQTVNGKPVLSVWWRVWGYDPYERGLDWDPWHYLGTYTDESPDAILTGQPGYVTGALPSGVDTTPDNNVAAEGFFWWGWGEIDPASPRAPKGSYVLAGENARGPAAVAASEVAYAAKTLAVDPLGGVSGGAVTLTGARGPGAEIVVDVTRGHAGAVEYPTATTWRCVVTGLGA